MKAVVTNQMKLMLAGSVYLAVFLMVGTMFTLRAADVVAMQDAEMMPAPAVLEHEFVVEPAETDSEENSRDTARATEDGNLAEIDAGILLEPAVRAITRTSRRIIF